MDRLLGVKLTEDDVPGAKFTCDVVEDHTNLQLRRWLACRGLKTTGKKSQLVERCRNCIQSGRNNDIDVSVDGGKWFQKKQDQSPTPGTSGSSSNILPIFGWKVFSLESLPNLFNYGNVYHWIVETVPSLPDDGTDDGDDDPVASATEKPLRRGRLYVSSGHVGEVKVKCEGNKFHYKASVLPSMQGDTYTVMATLSTASGSVIDASCHCKASALGRCSHVAALLLFLSDHHRVPTTSAKQPTCTDLPCQWNRGQKRKNPQNISLASYSSYKERNKVINFDPRPPGTVTGQEDINRFLKDLETGRNTEELSMWETVLCRTYADYCLSSERKNVLCVLVSELYANLFVGDIPTMLVGTTDQALSDKWFQQRYCRMTASTAKESMQLWNALESCGPTEGVNHRLLNFLRQKLWGLDRVVTWDMTQGILLEDTARLAYCDEKKSVEPDFSVKKSGLWVSGELACSPDGLVMDPQETPPDGLLEIKVLKIFPENSFDEVCLMSSDSSMKARLARQCFLLENQTDFSS